MIDALEHTKIGLALIALVTACSSGSSSSGGVANSPDGTVSGVVSQSTTGAITPFTARSQAATTVAFSGPDAVVSVWKSQLTFYAGTIPTDATLAMQLIPSGITQTPGFQIVSPLLSFQATTAAGALPRAALRKTMQVQTIVDRFVDDLHTVVIMILNYGTATEARYAILPADLTFVVQADKSRLVTFETRDTNFAFAVAVTDTGGAPGGYSVYPAVPRDVSALTASTAGVADETSGVKLSWTPPANLPAGYQLQLADAAVATQGCAAGQALPAAQVTTVTTNFPVQTSKASTVLTGLASDQTVYLQLCAANSRTPPDVSPGAVLTYVLPRRAEAVLSGTPTNPSHAAPLNVTVGGDGVTTYQYALLDYPAVCTGAVYSAWTEAQTPIADTVASGPHLLCVLAKKNDHNVQVVPTTFAWTVNLTPPSAFSIAAVTTPTNLTTPKFTWQPSGGSSAYKVTLASDAACTATVQAANAFTESFTAAALADGSYFFCVTAVDSAGNATPATNTGVPFVIDTVPPVFTSLGLVHDVAGGYLNAAGYALSNPLVGNLVASDNVSATVTAAYKLVSAATACDAALAYGALPIDSSPDFGGDGSYKVCVRINDAAGNISYGGASPTIVKKVAPPHFTSVTLANEAADTYISLADSMLSNPLVTPAVGTLFDTAKYALTTFGTPCNSGGLTYASALPLDNSVGFVSDGPYIVCVQLSDNAMNPSVYGFSATIHLKKAQPKFTALALANDAAGGYVNAAQRSDGTALGGTLTGLAYDTAAYKLVPAGTTCNNLLTYGPMPDTASLVGPDGSYDICAQLSDNAGNPADYGPSGAFVLDTTPPGAFSLTTPAAAATVNTNAPAISWGTSAGAAFYDVTLDAAPGCPSPAQTYAGVTAVTQAVTTLADGVWYVCLRARDNAGNITAAANSGLSFTVATGVWSAVSTLTAPSARGGHTVVWTGGRAIVWGGFDGTTYSNTGGLYNPAGDTWAPTVGTAAPLGRWHHTATWTGSAMVVWGGSSGATLRGDGGVYTLGAPDTWAPTQTVSAPTARTGHTAVWSGADVIIWGGLDGTGEVNTGAAYTPGSDVWTATDGGLNLPANRQKHTAVWTGAAMIVWGGSAGGTAMGDGAVYTPGTPGLWEPVQIAGAPTAREGHTAIWTGTKMVVFGGHNGSVYYDDGGIYDPTGSGSWTSITADAALTQRAQPLVVWDDTHGRMIVWGGDGGTGVYRGDGGVFDPAGNLWTVPATNAGSAPTARSQLAGVWSGTEMLLFGGYDGTSYVATGSRFTPP